MAPTKKQPADQTPVEETLAAEPEETLEPEAQADEATDAEQDAVEPVNPYEGFKLVAIGDVAVHTIGDYIEGRQSTTRTVILAPGDSVFATDVPKHQLEAVEAGECPRLVLVSAEEAEDYAMRVSAGLPIPGMTVEFHEAKIYTEPGRVAIQHGEGLAGART